MPSSQDHHAMGRAPREVLRSSNLRCTRQRELVYEALASTHTHPTAEELFDLVRRLEPGLSLATVYNTLEVFVRSGLAQRIPCPSGATRYDSDMRDHVHLTTSDGRVMDVPEDLGVHLVHALSPSLREDLENRLGVTLGRVSLNLVVHGLPERLGAASDGASENA
ncbi:MAG: transcriptional repressor [Phycisphaeraceae bacterium]|nr:transcriptional repressor [Phycisphaeraceae bacterium]